MKTREEGKNDILALIEKITNHKGDLLITDENIVFPRAEIFGAVLELSLNLSGSKEIYSSRDYSKESLGSIININKLCLVKDETRA